MGKSARDLVNARVAQLSEKLAEQIVIASFERRIRVE
jgi:hypothetical protein